MGKKNNALHGKIRRGRVIGSVYLFGIFSFIIMSAVGDMSTFVPAIAMTDAAEAAIPSILTVTSPW